MKNTIKNAIENSSSREDLIKTIILKSEYSDIAEIGVYNATLSKHLLDNCPKIKSYTLIDPWQHLPKWNKPANKCDAEFDSIYKTALNNIENYSDKTRVLRGTTLKMLKHLKDKSLDIIYIDGDHTLRGITIDLIALFPKLREGGLIIGDDFHKSIWQHESKFEPTFVFPFAVHFAEATDNPIYALPYNQFLIEKTQSQGFTFNTLPGYEDTSIRNQTNLQNVVARKLKDIKKIFDFKPSWEQDETNNNP